MVLSGLAMIIVGVWLTTQAIGGNLAGRIRSWAAGVTGAEGDASRITGGGTRTGGASEPSGASGVAGGGARAK